MDDSAAWIGAGIALVAAALAWVAVSYSRRSAESSEEAVRLAQEAKEEGDRRYRAAVQPRPTIAVVDGIVSKPDSVAELSFGVVNPGGGAPFLLIVIAHRDVLFVARGAQPGRTSTVNWYGRPLLSFTVTPPMPEGQATIVVALAQDQDGQWWDTQRGVEVSVAPEDWLAEKLSASSIPPDQIPLRTAQGPQPT